MVDIQPDIVQLKQQQLESPSSSVPNHVRSSSLRQQSVRTPDQLDGDARQPSLRRSDQHSSSLRAPNHRQLTSVMETALEDVTDEKQGRWSENFPEGHINQMSTRKPNEPDYSQMNSINASDQTSFRNQRANLRQSLEQLAANVPGQTSQHTPISNGQSQLLQRNTSRDLSEEDHMAEIENIFSYLAEEEQDMLEQGSRAEASQNSPEMSQHVTGLLSRPSLRYRRDVRCPNLLIANQVSDAQKKPAPVKRRLTLPSIVKYGTTGPVVGRGTGVFVASNDKENVHETKPVETIVIEEGVRKRLEEEKEYRPPPLPPDIDPVEEVLEPPKELRRRYRLESVKLTKRSDLGSLPNVSMFRQMEGRALPRQEAEMLCLKKREELNQLREIEEQMRRRAVVLKIGDFKDWCRRHALTLFLIAVNVMLAVAFKKLLSS